MEKRTHGEKNTRKELGQRGEEIAARFLKKQGYKILERNFRSRYGEIDIICINDRSIIFVEVKTRTGTGYGSPEESITEIKKQHIRKVALIYLEAHPQTFKEIRFDVIGILLEDKKPHINHIMAAF